MEQNHCGRLGFSIDTILACFDPEVKEQISAQNDLRFEKRCRNLIFKVAAMVAISDFLSAHFAILCLISALIIIKFRFNWII